MICGRGMGKCRRRAWRFITWVYHDEPQLLVTTGDVLCRPCALEKKKLKGYGERPLDQAHTFGNPRLGEGSRP